MRVFNSANYSSLDSSVGRLQIESKSKWNRNELKCRYRRFESGSRELLFSCKVQSEREENPHCTFFFARKEVVFLSFFSLSVGCRHRRVKKKRTKSETCLFFLMATARFIAHMRRTEKYFHLTREANRVKETRGCIVEPNLEKLMEMRWVSLFIFYSHLRSSRVDVRSF